MAASALLYLESQVITVLVLQSCILRFCILRLSISQMLCLCRADLSHMWSHCPLTWFHSDTLRRQHVSERSYVSHHNTGFTATHTHSNHPNTTHNNQPTDSPRLEPFDLFQELFLFEATLDDSGCMGHLGLKKQLVEVTPQLHLD